MAVPPPPPGLARRADARRGQVLTRLLHVDGEPAVVRVRQLAARPRPVRRRRPTARDVAEEAIARMRFALGVDDDLRPFHERFRHDPLIGPPVRARPYLRVRRRPTRSRRWLGDLRAAHRVRARRGDPAADRRRARAGAARAPGCATSRRRSGRRRRARAPGGLRPQRRAARSRCVKAAREVAARPRRPARADHERGWRRLRAIPGIGPWTVEILALHGQGRYDQLPAGDLAFLKLVGRLRTGGARGARDEEEVRAFFAPYAPYAGAGRRLRAHKPSPGRNSLVSGPRRRRPLEQLVGLHPAP